MSASSIRRYECYVLVLRSIKIVEEHETSSRLGSTWSVHSNTRFCQTRDGANESFNIACVTWRRTGVQKWCRWSADWGQMVGQKTPEGQGTQLMQCLIIEPLQVIRLFQCGIQKNSKQSEYFDFFLIWTTLFLRVLDVSGMATWVWFPSQEDICIIFTGSETHIVVQRVLRVG